jgi:hypothetical protein
MKTESFVSYALALKLKEKGFDEPCLKYAWNEKDIVEVPPSGVMNFNVLDQYCTSIPTYFEVADWFRDKHKLSLEIESTWSNDKKEAVEYRPWVTINRMDIDVIDDDEVYFDDYYKAFEVCVEDALELI